MLIKYSPSPDLYTRREMETSSYSRGRAPWLLLNVRVTSAIPYDRRLEVPAKITSSIR